MTKEIKYVKLSDFRASVISFIFIIIYSLILYSSYLDITMGDITTIFIFSVCVICLFVLIIIFIWACFIGNFEGDKE